MFLDKDYKCTENYNNEFFSWVYYLNISKNALLNIFFSPLYNTLKRTYRLSYQHFICNSAP